MRMTLFLAPLILLSVVSGSNAQVDNLSSENLAKITAENITDVTLLAEFDVSYPVTEIVWSPDAHDILIATSENLWKLDLSTQTLDELLLGQKESMRYVSGVSEIAMWDANEQAITTYNFERAIPLNNASASGSVAINHDGSMYAIGGIDAVMTYDLQSGEQLNEFTVEQYKECEFACPIHALAFSPDDNLLVFASAVSEVESAIVDLNTGEKTTPSEVGAWELIFSPDNRLIASATGAPGYIPDRLLLTDANTGEAVAVVELYVSSIVFSRSGELLAVGVYNDDAPNPDEATGLIYVFEIDQLVANRDLQPVMTLSTVRPPSAIAFSTDDKVIAIGDAGKLLLWGVPSND